MTTITSQTAIETNLRFNIGAQPVDGPVPFTGVTLDGDQPNLGCRGLAADPVEAALLAHALHRAACVATVRWGAKHLSGAGEHELRLALGGDPFTPAVLNGLPGRDAVWPYEVTIGSRMLADLPPHGERRSACDEKTSRLRIGSALRADTAVQALHQDGVQLSFRRAIGWLPETQGALVRFGLWRRDTDEPIAIGCDTANVVVSALFDEMPVHRKTGIVQTDAVRQVARAS